ncbi:MAG: pyridoxal phosphate-dependent aminotransferase [Actinobacteria bacterium]|nr:pyridoxal phosphate-dependent aminotransferase [Actinomycetota bacterium]
MSGKTNELKFSSRILRVGESPTFALERKVDEMDVILKKEGDFVVRFGIGQPDFNTPENIKEAGKKAIDENKTRYTQSTGIKELKQAIADKFLRENSIKYAPENILAGIGAKQVLDCIVRTFIDTGDKVLVPKPYWVSYTQQVILSGGVPIEVNYDKNLKIELEHLKEIIRNYGKSPGGIIKLLILNSPNNPTGAVYTRDELEKIVEVCLENNIIIVSDEVYEKFIYGNAEHFSPASFSEELKDIVITVNAVSKTYAMTGWRIGYCAANSEIIKQMTKVQDQSPSNPCTPAQWSALEALKGNQDSVEIMREEYERRRDYIYDRLIKIKGIQCTLPDGAFYVFPRVSSLYNEKIKNSMEFSNALLEKSRVAVVPGSAFGDDNYVRISYAVSMDKIVEGMNRFEEFCSNI